MSLSDYIALVVPIYIPPAIMAVLVGYVFSASMPALTIKLIFALISASLITAGYNSFNAIYDKEIDKINKPHRPVPRGSLKEQHVFRLSSILFLLSLIFACLINWRFLLIDLVAIVLAVSYSHPWSYLKRRFIVGTVVGTSIYAILFPLAGWALTQNRSIPIIVITILFFLGLGIGVLKDFEDLRGDIKYRIMTVPHVLGRKNGAFFSSASLVVSLLLLVYFVWIGSLAIKYLAIIVFIALAILNTSLVLSSLSKETFKRTFVNGMVILTLLEMVMIIATLI